MAEYKPFKMKGHTLPGINQRSEGDTDLPDGRSGSSPFQKHGGAHHGTGTDWEHQHNEPVSHPDGPDAHNIKIPKKSPAKQFIKGHRGQYHRFKAPKYDFTGISKDPKPTSMPKSFNITGSSASDTPGYKDTKMAKDAAKKEFLKKNVVKPKPHVKPKGVFGPGTRPLHPKVVKDIAKVTKVAKNIGKRFLGPVGVALTAYDVVKTIPKVVKATKKSLKKEAKTGSTVGKPKY